MSRHLIATCLIMAVALPGRAAQLPEPGELRGWVAEMKAADRGPFARIRWFCKDGTVLPPEPNACKAHGGGAQHGEWSERVRALREGGYLLANVYSDLDVAALLASANPEFGLGQMLIEQYLIRADDGWILRRARSYRGAYQEEGERAGARRLLLAMAGETRWSGHRLLMLRTAAKLLEHGADTPSLDRMRQLASTLAQTEPRFLAIRNKIHARPEPGDAARVREFAGKAADPAQFEALAGIIDEVFRAPPVSTRLQELATRHAGRDPALAGRLQEAARRLQAAGDARARYLESAAQMAALRDAVPLAASAGLRLDLIDAGIAMEATHFAAASALRPELAARTRSEHLALLRAGTDALYGAALISARQRAALEESFAGLAAGSVPLRRYKQAADYLSLVPGWSTQWLRFHFGDALRKLSELEPSADLFVQDQLRASPGLFFAAVLDAVVRDANRLAGVRNQLFGEDAGAGLRSLNPGLARGRLSMALQGEGAAFDAAGIYVLPETIAELPPVAGILTAGEGNPLSHIQLLARNLGIPNVAVDEALLGRLEAASGRNVILAASPLGSVRLSEDGGEWETVFGRELSKPEALIEPDLAKLDLPFQDLVRLSALRATDSGRIAGPKAANLGELYHHYPEAVADGLVVPFGVFRAVLERPFENSGQSTFEWMVGNYRRLEALPAGSEQRKQETEAFRARVQAWIEKVDPGEALRERLRKAMQEAFGRDGSYGVFVRSDTNVEDLPGFTGAGLNLTVPNVVGVDKIIAAIPRVWASPFSARAFAWRQAHMPAPEHVYPSVLLMRSVPAEKSGVMVTQDVDTGDRGWLSVAVNEGVGGAVDGQAAESLRVEMATGATRMLAQATAPIRRAINPSGGVDKLPVSESERVLEADEIRQLVELARELPRRFPAIVDAEGKPAPADVEFGFLGGRLALFQIRPFLESKRARRSLYLKSLDEGLRDLDAVTVVLGDVPGGDR